jgi:hypothetical protein
LTAEDVPAEAAALRDEIASVNGCPGST